MSFETTPSKKVSHDVLALKTSKPTANIAMQTASAIEDFKMESPVKQPQFNAQENKENTNDAVDPRYASDEVAVPIKGIPMLEQEPEKKPEVASTVKAEEADEPLLQENPHRFVLFPIKYHEVCTRS